MAAGSSKSVPVQFSDVLDAFMYASMGMQYEYGAYICRTTGKIYFSPDDAAEEEPPEDLEDSDDYVAVPHKNELDLGRDLVFSFVSQELPDDWDFVRDIFRSRGAYGRFKTLLHARDVLAKWYAFEGTATEKALRAWCEDVGIELSDPPPAVKTG